VAGALDLLAGLARTRGRYADAEALGRRTLAIREKALGAEHPDVAATLAVYDTMQILSCPVATYCVGQAASGAAVLLAGGTKGKRHILPNARVMLHQPYGGVQGQISDIEIQANEIIRYREVLNQILATHTGQPIEQIAKDTDRDFFLGAEESKKYGLVDDVLQKMPGAEDEKD